MREAANYYAFTRTGMHEEDNPEALFLSMYRHLENIVHYPIIQLDEDVEPGSLAPIIERLYEKMLQKKWSYDLGPNQAGKPILNYEVKPGDVFNLSDAVMGHFNDTSGKFAYMKEHLKTDCHHYDGEVLRIPKKADVFDVTSGHAASFKNIPCIYDTILSQQLLAKVVIHNITYLVVANINPLGNMHLLLVSEEPYPQQFSDPAMMETGMIFARAMGSEYSVIANSKNAGASIFHFHFQIAKEVFPFWRQCNDGTLTIRPSDVLEKLPAIQDSHFMLGHVQGWPVTVPYYRGVCIPVLARFVAGEAGVSEAHNIPYNFGFKWEGEVDGYIQSAFMPKRKEYSMALFGDYVEDGEDVYIIADPFMRDLVGDMPRGVRFAGFELFGSIPLPHILLPEYARDHAGARFGGYVADTMRDIVEQNGVPLFNDVNLVRQTLQQYDLLASNTTFQLGKVEIINQDVVNKATPKLWAFDFDDTVSTILSFWKEVEGAIVARILSGDNPATPPQEEHFNEAPEMIDPILFKSDRYAEAIRRAVERGFTITRSVEEYVQEAVDALLDRAETERPSWKDNPPIVPGIDMLWEALYSLGKDVAIITGGESLEQKTEWVRELGLLGYCNKGMLGYPKNKQQHLQDLMRNMKLAPHQVVMFDDSVIGIKNAKAAGVVAVGIAHSAEARQELIDAGADIVIHGDYRDVQKILTLFPADVAQWKTHLPVVDPATLEATYQQVQQKTVAMVSKKQAPVLIPNTTHDHIAFIVNQPTLTESILSNLNNAVKKLIKKLPFVSFQPMSSWHIALYAVEATEENTSLDELKKRMIEISPDIMRQIGDFPITIQGFIVTPDGAIIAQGHVNDESVFKLRRLFKKAFPRKRTFLAQITLGRIPVDEGKPVSPTERAQQLAQAVSVVNEYQNLFIGKIIVSQGRIMVGHDRYGLDRDADTWVVTTDGKVRQEKQTLASNAVFRKWSNAKVADLLNADYSIDKAFDSAAIFQAIINDKEVFELMKDILMETYTKFLGEKGTFFVKTYFETLEALPKDADIALLKATFLKLRDMFQTSGLPEVYYGEFRHNNLKKSVEIAGIERFTGTVADIGCDDNALGEVLLSLAPQVDKVIGSDLERRDSVKEGANLFFREQKSPTDLSCFKDNEVDTVVFRYSAHHMNDDQQRKIFSEIRRIAKPGATIIIYEDTYSLTLSLEDMAMEELNFNARLAPIKNPIRLRLLLSGLDTFSQGIKDKHQPFPYNYKTVEEWQRFFKKQGFQEDRVLNFGIPIYDLHQAPLTVFILNNEKFASNLAQEKMHLHTIPAALWQVPRVELVPYIQERFRAMQYDSDIPAGKYDDFLDSAFERNVVSQPFTRTAEVSQGIISKDFPVEQKLHHLFELRKLAYTTVMHQYADKLGLDAKVLFAGVDHHDLGHTVFAHVGEGKYSELATYNIDYNHARQSVVIMKELLGKNAPRELVAQLEKAILNHSNKKDTVILAENEYGSPEGAMLMFLDMISRIGADLRLCLMYGLADREAFKAALPELRDIMDEGNTFDDMSEVITGRFLNDLMQHSTREVMGFSDEYIALRAKINQFLKENFIKKVMEQNHQVEWARGLVTVLDDMPSDERVTYLRTATDAQAIQDIQAKGFAIPEAGFLLGTSLSSNAKIKAALKKYQQSKNPEDLRSVWQVIQGQIAVLGDNERTKFREMRHIVCVAPEGMQPAQAFFEKISPIGIRGYGKSWPVTTKGENGWGFGESLGDLGGNTLVMDFDIQKETMLETLEHVFNGDLNYFLQSVVTHRYGIKTDTVTPDISFDTLRQLFGRYAWNDLPSQKKELIVWTFLLYDAARSLDGKVDPVTGKILGVDMPDTLSRRDLEASIFDLSKRPDFFTNTSDENIIRARMHYDMASGIVAQAFLAKLGYSPVLAKMVTFGISRTDYPWSAFTEYNTSMNDERCVEAVDVFLDSLNPEELSAVGLDMGGARECIADTLILLDMLDVYNSADRYLTNDRAQHLLALRGKILASNTAQDLRVAAQKKLKAEKFQEAYVLFMQADEQDGISFIIDPAGKNAKAGVFGGYQNKVKALVDTMPEYRYFEDAVAYLLGLQARDGEELIRHDTSPPLVVMARDKDGKVIGYSYAVAVSSLKGHRAYEVVDKDLHMIPDITQSMIDDSYYIGHWLVHPDHRDEGLRFLLMRQLVARARERGIPYLTGSTYVDELYRLRQDFGMRASGAYVSLSGYFTKAFILAGTKGVSKADMLLQQGVQEHPDWVHHVTSEALRQTQRKRIKFNNVYISTVEQEDFPENETTFYDEFFMYTMIEGTKGLRDLYIANTSAIDAAGLNRDTCWWRRQELARYIRQQGITLEESQIGFLALQLMIKLNCSLIGPGTTADQQRQVVFENTQREFERRVRGMLEETYSYDVEQYQGDHVPGYSHIDHFSWIIATELRHIREILQVHPDENITIVDDGTGFGHLILTMAHLLTPAERERVQFIGTDIKPADMASVRTVVDNGEFPELAGRVMWHSDEHIEQAAHLEHLREWDADIVIVNHVLEHLQGDVREIMARWIQGAARSVMISIPFEQHDPNNISPHETIFTRESLIELGNRLADQEQVRVNTDFAAGGMLIFDRESSRIASNNKSKVIKRMHSQALAVQDVSALVSLADELAAVPEKVMNAQKKMDLLADMLAETPANPTYFQVERARTIAIQTQVVASDMRSYCDAHPERTKLKVAVFGIGNGDSFFFEFLNARVLGIKASYVGIDNDASELDQAREKYTAFPEISLEVYDLLTLDPADAVWQGAHTFDYINIRGVLHEVYSARAIVWGDGTDNSLDHAAGVKAIRNVMSGVAALLREGGGLFVFDGFAPEKPDELITIKVSDAMIPLVDYVIQHFVIPFHLGRDLQAYKFSNGVYEVTRKELKMLTVIRFLKNTLLSERPIDINHEIGEQMFPFMTRSEWCATLNACDLAPLAFATHTQAGDQRFFIEEGNITILRNEVFPAQFLHTFAVKGEHPIPAMEVPVHDWGTFERSRNAAVLN